MTTTIIRRIQISSAFRVGAVINGLIFAIFGLLSFILPALLFGSFTRSAVIITGDADVRALGEFFGTAGALTLLCFYGVGIVAAVIFGGLYFAVVAWLYNLTAGWVGGVQVELDTFAGGYADQLDREISDAKFRRTGV